MGVKLNIRKFRKIVSNSKDLEKRVSKVFEQQLALRQSKMVRSFDEHPVTVEIQAGNSAFNSSGLLGGYGNLFTFIGFSEDSDPIKTVRSYLAKKINYKKTKTTLNSKGFSIFYSAETPGIQELAGLTQLSHLGRSWVTGIEKGKIDGFQYYLNRSKRMRGSRSGKGIQIDRQLRNKSVRPVAYVDEMLKKFRRSLQEIK